MKVALITAVLSPAAGGLAASVPGLARGLEALDGTGVHVLGVEDALARQAATDWARSVHPHGVVGPRAFSWAPGLLRTLNMLSPDVTDVQGLWTYPSLANLRHHQRRGTPYVVGAGVYDEETTLEELEAVSSQR